MAKFGHLGTKALSIFRLVEEHRTYALRPPFYSKYKLLYSNSILYLRNSESEYPTLIIPFILHRFEISHRKIEGLIGL